jgi:hypothetical protein
MHPTAPSHWSRSIVAGGRDASERVVAIIVARRNCLVVGVSAYRYFIESACRYFVGCLQDIPYYWFPVALLLASAPISLIEQAIIRRGKRNTGDR